MTTLVLTQMEGVPEAELVALSLEGSREAYEEIVKFFLATWKQLRSLREPSKLRSWLCRIARNIVNNAVRRQGRQPADCAEGLNAAAEIPSADRSEERRVGKE